MTFTDADNNTGTFLLSTGDPLSAFVIVRPFVSTVILCSVASTDWLSASRVIFVE